jgi:hypothetical protein
MASAVDGLHPLAIPLTGDPVSVSAQTVGPTTWYARVSQALALLCGGAVPPMPLVEAYFTSDDDRLQHWASDRCTLGWHQGVGVLDAAVTLADSPAEGEGHEDRPQSP